MLRSRRSVSTELVADDGSASLEFITAGVLLLVPLVYLSLTVSQIEAAAFATEGAARHAARLIARDGEQGREAAARSIGATAADFGLDEAALLTRVACEPDPGDCERPGSVVTVTVRAEVPLPLIPAWMSGAVPLSVPVESAASIRVSDFARLS